jgi:hypothetical protein
VNEAGVAAEEASYLTQRSKGAKVAKRCSKRSGDKEMTENELSYEIIGAAIEVHRELGGPGLLEDTCTRRR